MLPNNFAIAIKRLLKRFTFKSLIYLLQAASDYGQGSQATARGSIFRNMTMQKFERIDLLVLDIAVAIAIFFNIRRSNI